MARISSPPRDPTAQDEAGLRGRGLPLFAVCLGFFVVILDTTVVNVALPPIGTALDMGVTGLQWVVDGYTLVFAALLLFGGALGDRLGIRRTYLIGLALFGGASALCGLAPTADVLVAARLVQGAGAALLVPSSLALLGVIFPERAARAKAVGVWGAVGASAASFGPVLGGAVADTAGWRTIFFINVPVCLIAAVLIYRLVTAVLGRPRALQMASQLAIVVAIGGLVFALIEMGSPNRQSAAIVVGVVAAVAAVVALCFLQRRGNQRILPPKLLLRPAFLGGNAVGFVLNFGFYGQLFVISLYFQEELGYSPLVAGLALLPETAMGIVASTLGGRLTARRGPAPAMLGGLGIGAAGLAGLVVAGSDTSFAVLVVPLMLVGFGMAFCMPAATTATVEAAGDEFLGLASAAFNASRQIGGAVGVAALGSVLAASQDSIDGLRWALVIAAASFVLGALVTYRTKEKAT